MFAQLSPISRLTSATYNEFHIHHMHGASIYPETPKVKIRVCVVDKKPIITIVRTLWIAYFFYEPFCQQEPYTDFSKENYSEFLIRKNIGFSDNIKKKY